MNKALIHKALKGVKLSAEEEENIKFFQTLFVNLLVDSQRIIDTMDDLEGTPLYKHKLKSLGKAFKGELENCMGRVFGNDEGSRDLLELYDMEVKMYKDIRSITLDQRPLLLQFVEQLMSGNVLMMEDEEYEEYKKSKELSPIEVGA